MNSKQTPDDDTLSSASAHGQGSAAREDGAGKQSDSGGTYAGDQDRTGEPDEEADLLSQIDDDDTASDGAGSTGSGTRNKQSATDRDDDDEDDDAPSGLSTGGSQSHSSGAASGATTSTGDGSGASQQSDHGGNKQGNEESPSR